MFQIILLNHLLFIIFLFEFNSIYQVGEGLLISLISNRIIHKYRFNDRVLHLSFSPDGKHIAACKLNKSKQFSCRILYFKVDLKNVQVSQ